MMDTTPQLIKLFSLTSIAFILAVALTPILTHYLYKYKLAKKIREKAWDGTPAKIFHKLHKVKEGVPTMGGLLVWVTAAILTLVFNQSRSQTWLPVFALVTTGFLGLFDDWLNVKGIGEGKGLSVKLKFLFQFLIAGLGAWWFFYKLGYSEIAIPGGQLFGWVQSLDIGAFYIPLFILIFVFITNAVNITDGLDGLAGGTLAASFGAVAIIAWIQGQYGIAAFSGTIIGSLLAFLWFNIYPARFIMGDTGSFALGATLAVLAFLTNSVLLLPIYGFIFVVEGLSSLIQRFSKKYLGRKVFLVAPIHHHFEALNWPETKITMRFWIIAVVTATIGVVFAAINI